MTQEQAPEVPVRFYRSATGREPVLEGLRALDRKDRRAIGLDLMRVQFGWPIGMPLVRSLKDGLLGGAFSSAGPEDSSFDTVLPPETLVVLHGFIKKTKKTPAEEIELAKRRMKEVMQ